MKSKHTAADRVEEGRRGDNLVEMIISDGQLVMSDDHDQIMDKAVSTDVHFYQDKNDLIIMVNQMMTRQGSFAMAAKSIAF